MKYTRLRSIDIFLSWSIKLARRVSMMIILFFSILAKLDTISLYDLLLEIRVNALSYRIFILTHSLIVHEALNSCWELIQFRFWIMTQSEFLANLILKSQELFRQNVSDYCCEVTLSLTSRFLNGNEIWKKKKKLRYFILKTGWMWRKWISHQTMKFILCYLLLIVNRCIEFLCYSKIETTFSYFFTFLFSSSTQIIWMRKIFFCSKIP